MPRSSPFRSKRRRAERAFLLPHPHPQKREEAAGEAASSPWITPARGWLVKGPAFVRPCREGGCFSRTYSAFDRPKFRDSRRNFRG